MKSLFIDWHRFTWLQRLLVVIDLILNPKATTYPFLYTDSPDILGFNENLPSNHFVVKQFEKDGKYYVWCIRWL